MIFSKSSKNRLKIFSLIAIAASIILFFIYNNLQKNVVYFYAPQEIKNLKDLQNLFQKSIRPARVVNAIKVISSYYMSKVTKKTIHWGNPISLAVDVDLHHGFGLHSRSRFV